MSIQSLHHTHTHTRDNNIIIIPYAFTRCILYTLGYSCKRCSRIPTYNVCRCYLIWTIHNIPNNMERGGIGRAGVRKSWARAARTRRETFKRWFSRVMPNYCHRTFILLLYARTAHGARTKMHRYLMCAQCARYIRFCSNVYTNAYRIEGDNYGLRPNIIIL